MTTTKLTLVLLILVLGAVSCSGPATTPTEAAPPQPTAVPTAAAPQQPTATPVVEPTTDSNAASNSDTPPIIAQGEATLKAHLNDFDRAYSYLDLETGTVGDVENGDLKFMLSAGSMVFGFFVPVNDGVSADMGSVEPSPADCWALLGNLSESETSLHQTGIDLIPATYLCLLTNEGHMSIIKTLSIEDTDEENVMQVTVSFTTWGD